MRIRIVIDDALMAQALEKTGFESKRDVVEAGLKLLIRLNSPGRARAEQIRIRKELDAIYGTDPEASKLDPRTVAHQSHVLQGDDYCESIEIDRKPGHREP